MYNFKRQIVPAGLTNHPNRPLKSVSYITIHNADTYGLGATAQASANYLTNNSQGAQASWHYTVDDLQAIQSFEDTQSCWHAGDGTSGAGNSTSLAIEISTNWGFAAKGQTVPGIKTWEQVTAVQRAEGEIKFKKACDNAARLTADLLKKHGLGTERVVQHNHWKSTKYPSGKNCPYALRQGVFGTSWGWFIGLVTKYYTGAAAPEETEDNNMNAGDTVKITSASATYSNGKTVPDSVKNKPFTVEKVNGSLLLLKEIVSWVDQKFCTLVITAAIETVSKAQYDAVVKEKAALVTQVAELIAERDVYKDQATKVQARLNTALKLADQIKAV